MPHRSVSKATGVALWIQNAFPMLAGKKNDNIAPRFCLRSIDGYLSFSLEKNCKMKLDDGMNGCTCDPVAAVTQPRGLALRKVGFPPRKGQNVA